MSFTDILSLKSECSVKVKHTADSVDPASWDSDVGIK